MEDNALAFGLPTAMMSSIIQQHQKNVGVVIQLARLLLGEQTISLDNKTPSTELTEIVKELAGIILADSEQSLSEKRSPFSANQEIIDKVKEIGSRLNALGGTDLMGSIVNDYVPRCDRHELDLLWHGIGDWKA